MLKTVEVRPKKIVCIHQPDFAPYLGFFHRLLKVDLFVLLDDAQFVRKGKGWQNRDKIKTRQGEAWLTIPVQKAPLEETINHIRLHLDRKWVNSALNLLTENYRRAEFFDEYFPAFEKVLQSNHELLIDLNLNILDVIYKILDISVPTILASQLAAQGNKNERLIDILQKVSGTDYLSGVGARDYMDEKKFLKAGIAVHWQNFKHPIYPQLHGDFIPYLSVLDTIFNCGPEAKHILRRCDE